MCASSSLQLEKELHHIISIIKQPNSTMPRQKKYTPEDLAFVISAIRKGETFHTSKHYCENFIFFDVKCMKVQFLVVCFFFRYCVMFCGNAIGDFLPPIVVYKAKNLYEEWQLYEGTLYGI